MLPSREEYATMLGENLSEADCVRLFCLHKDDLLDGKYDWNYNLEYSYNEYCNELEYEEEVLGREE